MSTKAIWLADVFGLFILLTSRPVTCCNVLELGPVGFSYNILHLLHALPLFQAEERGVFLLDNTKFHYKCNKTGGWHDFFQPAEGLLSWTKSAEEEAVTVCQHQAFINVDSEITKVQASHMELENIALKRVWKYLPWVQSEVDQILREVKRQPGPTLAIHARGGDLSLSGGDSLFDDDSPPSMDEMLVGAFQRAFPNEQVRTCLVLGDDQEVIMKTADLAERVLGCATLRRAAFHAPKGYFQHEFGKEELPVRCKATLELLKDLEVFAAADFFIGSLESAVTRLAESLRFNLRGKERRTFADASQKQGDWYNRIRQYYGKENKAAAEDIRRTQAAYKP